MSKIFLTGHKGFLGSRLLVKLIECGFEVETDMRYLHTKKFSAIVHLAAKNNIKNEFDADLIESNIILTKEIFKVNTRILYSSSCVAAFPLNPYAYSKLYAEYLGSIHGNALGLRFHNIFGENNSKGIIKYLCDQKDGSRITIRGAWVIRDYIYIDCVVNEILRQLLSGGKVIDMKSVREKANSENRKPSEVLKEAIDLGNIEHIDIPYKVGVMDIGTGIGTQTIDLISLYCKLSGKKFSIDEVPPDSSEPISMISDNVVPHISLEEGLKLMLKKDLSQPVLSDIYNHIKNNK